MKLLYSDARLNPSLPLPQGFEYPADFLIYLLHEERELGGDDWDVLRWIWPIDLSYETDRIASALTEFRRCNPDRSDFYLVPFAQDAGDGLWFFSPDGIQFIDMSWKDWRPRPEPDKDFLSFVNRNRIECYKPPWK